MRFSTSLFLFLILISAAAFTGRVQAQSQSDGIQEVTGVTKNVSIFPNPAVEYVHIRIESVSAEHVKLTLHNIIGNEMPTETEVISEHELRVRVKDLASGYYLLAVKDNESKFRGTYKFLKK